MIKKLIECFKSGIKLSVPNNSSKGTRQIYTALQMTLEVLPSQLPSQYRGGATFIRNIPFKIKYDCGNSRW